MSNTTHRTLCFRLTRTDGAVFAFTDHDHPLTFGGVTYEARTALSPSEAAASLGLGADDQDISGGLSSDAITEADLALGLFDGADVVVFEVDWRDPAASAEVVGRYQVGEVERDQTAFRVEIRSQAAILQQTRGRRTMALCDADFGDARCGKDPMGPGMTGNGTVAVVLSETDFTATGLSSFPLGFFSHGVLTWTEGDNAGTRSEIRSSAAGFGLWTVPPNPIQAGDKFLAVAGCDKSFEMCRKRYGNGVNFRGFPTIAGESSGTIGRPGDPGTDGGSNYDFSD